MSSQSERSEQYLSRIFDLKLGGEGVEDMRCLCSCVNQAQGSLPEVDPPRRESQNQPFQLSLNRFLRVDFQGSRVTSDGGLLADLFRQSAYSRLAGYEDLNDATRLASDPTPQGGADGLEEGLGTRRGADLHPAERDSRRTCWRARRT